MGNSFNLLLTELIFLVLDRIIDASLHQFYCVPRPVYRHGNKLRKEAIEFCTRRFGENFGPLVLLGIQPLPPNIPFNPILHNVSEVPRAAT
ncbi:hypothetical protein ABIF50_010702 [Bradyrhizobium diazoefficiens]